MDDDPAAEILDATYLALCKHGYADLTIQNIADESDRSKATIHYHYDSKEELFAALLDRLYERYVARIDAADGDTARQRLDAVLDVLLADEAPLDHEFHTAVLAVTARAPHDDAIRERVAAFDRRLFETFRDVVATGVDAGEFDADAEPAVVAEQLVTTVKGAQIRRFAAERSTERSRDAVDGLVETRLQPAVAEGAGR
ncbi:TetR/AcrR family transcriptional regulator [Natronoarchaeum rubrum]|uniref:TetR/AcrR family transcriptional regulator n=1 Tax=Natronoarchaeum rubrum TaxID=755311 RepID=UPI0021114C90|nr:TetR/AcrR family transcriptional regulator [Natronoarchaeum rubrum]